LASAAAGINGSCDAWDAVSDSICDADGWPLDDKVYGDGKVKRDAEAWKHAEVFLDHGPAVLAGVRAAADGPDYVEGPISDDLRRMRGIDTILFRAEELRHEWNGVNDRVSGLSGLALVEDGWRHNSSLDIYTLPATADRVEALGKVADATVALHRSGLQVAVQPRLAQEVAARPRPAATPAVGHERGRGPARASPLSAAALAASPARAGIPGRAPVPAAVTTPAVRPVDPRIAYSRAR
jgi:hypothetical protein